MNNLTNTFDMRKYWDSYDRLHHYDHAEVLEHIKSIKGIQDYKVLDVCCGKGFFHEILIGMGIDAYGLDFSKNAGLMDKSGKFIKGDMIALPFKNNLFDIVSCMRSINYLSGEGEFMQFFREVDRVVKKQIILSFSNERKVTSKYIFDILKYFNFEPIQEGIKERNSDGNLYIFERSKNA